MVANPIESLMPFQKRRILCVLPIPYQDSWGFWHRDLGLIVRTFRSMGHDAWLVALKVPGQDHASENPVIVATKEELEDPAWWKNQAPYGAVLNFWGATRWNKIREAARTSTSRVIEKLDTAGIFSPRIWFTRYICDEASQNYDSHKYPGIISPIMAIIRTLLLWSFPNLLDRKRAAILSEMSSVVAESPIAVERTKRYIRSFNFPLPRTLCIPHPIDEFKLRANSNISRKSKIISVGRWDSHQKNFPLIIRVLERFLRTKSDWTCDLVGYIPAVYRIKYYEPLPSDLKKRINLCGVIPHSEIIDLAYSAKIFLMASRYESFGIAAAEALCCGCSVVGPYFIPSMLWFCSAESGTIYSQYTTEGVMDALLAESTQWAGRDRKPESIAAFWTGQFASHVIATSLVNLLNEHPSYARSQLSHESDN